MLVYAALPAMAEHDAARAFLDTAYGDRNEVVGVSHQSLFAFTRLLSSRRIMGDDAVTPAVAWEAAERFVDQDNARIIDAGQRHLEIARALLATPGLGSNDVPDVHLAALAIEHGLVLCTHDRGFARFEHLRWTDPLDPDGGR